MQPEHGVGEPTEAERPAASLQSSGGAPQIKQMCTRELGAPLDPSVLKKSRSTQSVHDLASLTKHVSLSWGHTLLMWKMRTPTAAVLVLSAASRPRTPSCRVRRGHLISWHHNLPSCRLLAPAKGPAAA